MNDIIFFYSMIGAGDFWKELSLRMRKRNDNEVRNPLA